MTAGNITLKQKADTASVSTTTNGAAAVNEVQQLNLGGATTGTFDVGGVTIDVTSACCNQTCNQHGQLRCLAGLGRQRIRAAESGTNRSGLLKLGRAVAKQQRNGRQPSISTITNGAAEVFQIVAVTLPDSPTEGTLNVTLDGSTSSDFNWNDSSPAFLRAGLAEAQQAIDIHPRHGGGRRNRKRCGRFNPLRKDCGIEIVTTQDGSSVGYTIDLASGSYAISAKQLGWTAGRKVDIGQGSYTLTGQDVALSKGFTLGLDSGSYALNGQAVGLTRSELLQSQQEAGTLTGQELGLAKGFAISIGQGLRPSRARCRPAVRPC